MNNLDYYYPFPPTAPFSTTRRPLHGHSCIDMIFCWVLSLRLNVVGWGNWLNVESLRLFHTRNSVNAFKKANRIENDMGI